MERMPGGGVVQDAQNASVQDAPPLREMARHALLDVECLR
jgi:hypothetical protein